MGKIILNRVLGHYVESIKADKEYANGALVGKGALVEGENRLYNGVEATAENHFLVTTPEVDPTKATNGLDFINAKGSVLRAHQLEIGDTFTVEQSLHGEGFVANDKLTVTAGKFAKGEGAYVVEYVTTVGADRRPAYVIRKVK